MTFEEWLQSAWLDDENREIRKRHIDKVRDRVKPKVVKAIEGPLRQVCHCDTHIAFEIMLDKDLSRQLVEVALEYLLGENFNGASGNYYYTWWKKYGEHNENRG